VRQVHIDEIAERLADDGTGVRISNPEMLAGSRRRPQNVLPSQRDLAVAAMGRAVR
jgi:hypothetical protein